MKAMEKEMSSGVRYYERDLLRYRPGKEPRKPYRKPAPAKAEA